MTNKITTFGKQIKVLRVIQGLSQDELAIKLHKTRQTIIAWESDKSVPSLSTIRELAYYFDVDVNTLTKLLK